MENPSKIILGIDPGTLLMGFCVIHCNGSTLQLQEMGVLKMKAVDESCARLTHIYRKVDELIHSFHPNCFAIEAPFFGKNVQSMLKLGRAQGVAIAAAINAGLTVSEYSPRKIKQSITGNGNAEKEQVWKMLQQILFLKDVEMHSYDASDALAVAVCHHFQGNAPIGNTGGKKKSWKEFVASNPERLMKNAKRSW